MSKEIGASESEREKEREEISPRQEEMYPLNHTLTQSSTLICTQLHSHINTKVRASRERGKNIERQIVSGSVKEYVEEYCTL